MDNARLLVETFSSPRYLAPLHGLSCCKRTPRQQCHSHMVSSGAVSSQLTCKQWVSQLNVRGRQASWWYYLTILSQRETFGMRRSSTGHICRVSLKWYSSHPRCSSVTKPDNRRRTKLHKIVQYTHSYTWNDTAIKLVQEASRHIVIITEHIGERGNHSFVPKPVHSHPTGKHSCLPEHSDHRVSSCCNRLHFS